MEKSFKTLSLLVSQGWYAQLALTNTDKYLNFIYLDVRSDKHTHKIRMYSTSFSLDCF